MDFSVVGLLASITTPISEANIGIFTISTFDTDYLLVKIADLNGAIEALVAYGHNIVGPDRADDRRLPEVSDTDRS
jgi:hypothetical protein